MSAAEAVAITISCNCDEITNQLVLSSKFSEGANDAEMALSASAVERIEVDRTEDGSAFCEEG